MPYIGKSPSAGVRQRYQYTATAGQTTFSGTDLGNLTLTYTDNNFVDVFQNGVLLKGGGTDYTATSGTSVVLATGASVSDVIEIIVYDVFSVGNFFNRTDSDSRYLSAAKGIDDQTSSNDDQLTITDTAVVINEDSDDVDFRVESDGNINMLHVDAGSDLVTIGGLTGTAGNEDAGYGPLQVGNTASSGTIIQMLANSSNTCTIHFGDAVSGDGRYAGFIQYSHANNDFTFGTNSSTCMKITSSGIYGDTTSSAADVQVDSNNVLRRSTSSRRYKNTINDATHGLVDLLKLRSVTFKGNNDGDTVFGGLIAEEVHDAGLTEFVKYNEDNQPDGLAYGNMVSVCIKAIQELSAKNDALEARIKKLEDG